MDNKKIKNSSQRAASKPAVKEEKPHEADKTPSNGIVLTTTTSTIETPQPVVQSQDNS
jgi:hypothetical protein